MQQDKKYVVIYYAYILSEIVKQALRQPKLYYLTEPITTRSF